MTWLDDSVFTAGDLKRHLGLSYRQVFTWDGRGAYRQDERLKGKWRRFSARQIAKLQLVKTLHEKVALATLLPLCDWLASSDSDQIVEQEADAFFVSDLITVFSVCAANDLAQVAAKAARLAEGGHAHIVSLRIVVERLRLLHDEVLYE